MFASVQEKCAGRKEGNTVVIHTQAATSYLHALLMRASVKVTKEQ